MFQIVRTETNHIIRTLTLRLKFHLRHCEDRCPEVWENCFRELKDAEDKVKGISIHQEESENEHTDS